MMVIPRMKMMIVFEWMILVMMVLMTIMNNMMIVKVEHDDSVDERIMIVVV